VFTAAELIATLETRYRRRFPLQAQRAFGEFPPTWRQWFLSIEAREGAVTGAPAKDFVAEFAQRPLREWPKAPTELGRLAGLWRLHRQRWEPEPREERGLRWFAALVSSFAHVCFVMLLFWLAIIAIERAPKKDEMAGEAVQVEFIGEGTPEDTGGGPVQGEDETQPAASTTAAAAPDTQASSAAPSAQPPTPNAPLPNAPPSTAEVPQPPQPLPLTASQPLAVTEPRNPPEEEPVFALPAPQLRVPQTAPRALTVPELRAPVSEVEMLEPRPPVRALQRTETARTPTSPELRERPTEIEMFEPLPDVQARRPTPRAPSPQVRTPDLRTSPTDVVMRESTPPTPAATRPASTAPVGPTATAQTRPAPSPPTAGGAAPRPSTTSGGRPAAPSGTRPATAGTGTGPAATPRPGGLPSQRRSDDWGDSNQNRPGNSTAGRSTGPGLFNPDGSIRLPSGSGQAGGGLPPGTVTEDFEKIDRMGTWLKRPPVDYTPGRLERFFVPHESLLEEWVRRNIREVFVPIPGTSKRIVCKVSLLQAGGGCTIDDPNLRDQEAEARKPPDVPFKPDLQEDQSGLKK
jgi:hypothetical protein